MDVGMLFVIPSADWPVMCTVYTVRVLFILPHNVLSVESRQAAWSELVTCLSIRCYFIGEEYKYHKP
jgi:hypothetical protein